MFIIRLDRLARRRLGASLFPLVLTLFANPRFEFLGTELIGQHVQLPAGVQALIGAAAAAQATSQGQVTNNGLGLIGVPAPNISGTASAVGGTAVYVPSANTLPTGKHPGFSSYAAPSDTRTPAPNGQAQQSAPVAIDAKCLIPGCGKHVHIDASGNKASNYCSLWHREYADAPFLIFTKRFLIFPPPPSSLLG